jgi:molecular chaperone DnaK (HSP70)
VELERIVRPVIERSRGPVEQALRDAGVTPAQIDKIVFVGGPTRMPVVRAFFEELFGRKAEMGVDPMECKDAEKYAEEDRRRRELADKLNNADAICYQGERFLADFGEKVAAEQRARGSVPASAHRRPAAA